MTLLATQPFESVSGGSVADYYLYLLDRSGRIVRRVDLEACEGDDHARDVAAAHPHHGGMELWQGDRLVETYGERKPD